MVGISAEAIADTVVQNMVRLTDVGPCRTLGCIHGVSKLVSH